ncbi:methyltransferase (DUF5641) [Popillia japonica]|uniref:Methyltransferase (DUF5641) n=1 Tax=Popillia japonica TaxID=7064 RepID=A0AAW1JGX6_POPJA
MDLLIRAKILMQEIWQLKLNWDESLPLHIQYKWICFTQEIESFSKVQIPRRVVSVNNAASYEIHATLAKRRTGHDDREYLNHLQTRTKWKTNGSGNLTPGRLVLLKEDNIPAGQWLTGRVEKVFFGAGQWLTGRVEKVFFGDDGVVRAASVKNS